jgi:hypothetical protein
MNAKHAKAAEASRVSRRMTTSFQETASRALPHSVHIQIIHFDVTHVIGTTGKPNKQRAQSNFTYQLPLI